MTDSEILKIRDEVINNTPAGTLAWEIDILVGRALLDHQGVERADADTEEIDSLRKRLSEALLAAERAREERNREHVRLNSEWMAKCEELRKDAERWNMNIQLMRRKHSQQAINEVISVVDAAMAKKEGA